MNKKIFAFFLIACIFTSSCKKGEYSDNMVSYLNDSGDTSYIVSYDLNTNREMKYKVGKKDDVFWACIDISEGGNALVLNTDEIYKIDSSGITKHSGIAERVVALKRICNKYLIISQFESEFKIKIFDETFHGKMFEKAVDGSYSGMDKAFEEGHKIYITSYDTKSGKSYLHTLNITDGYSFSGDVLLDFPATTVPIRIKEELYFFVNNRIYKNVGSKPVYELYKKGISQPEHVFGQHLNSHRILDGKKAIFLNGINNSTISIYDFNDNSKVLLDFPKNEAVIGIYSLHGRIIIISDKGIYEFSANKVENLTGIETSLVNQYS